MRTQEPMDIHRINRRTAFKTFQKLDEQFGACPGIVEMMRAMVREYGVDGAMGKCKFPFHIPAQAIELQRWCCEYFAFEEGQPGEAELIEAQRQALEART